MKGCKPLSPEELAASAAAMAENRFRFRDEALFQLGVRSGFRISELLSLRLKDVLQDGQVVSSVTVARANMKGKRDSRTVPLHKKAQGALAEWIAVLKTTRSSDPETFVFISREGENQPLNRRTAWHLLKKAFNTAQVSGKTGTHSMRKTFAKNVHAAAKGDLKKTQKAMGHKNINSTASYIDFDDKEIDELILGSE